ncbi:MAG: 6-phosphogluconolactonase [Patescibacteria group bacterium]
MKFIEAADEKQGVEAMAAKITAALLEGKKVLWLICGGSNIPYAKQAMDMVRTRAAAHLHNLTIGQTDERFGPVGHKDSNWQQMQEAHFNFEGTQILPILKDESLEETVRAYAATITRAFEEVDVVVAQFGIGADGHVAGMLPHTGGLEAREFVFGYEAAPFVRITLTPPAFTRIDAAYTFAFGASKRDAVTKLWQKDVTIDEMPCQILKRIEESRFYSDQL